MITLFWLGLCALALSLLCDVIDDFRNARAFPDETGTGAGFPVATVVVRAEPDVRADISRALDRDDPRWN